MIARAVADVAPKYVGQPLVVVNKVGAAMVIAAQYVAAAKPDGYTLNVAGGSETVAAPPLPERPLRPHQTTSSPIIRFIIERVGFYVKADSPWKTHERLRGRREAESRQVLVRPRRGRRHPPRHHAGRGETGGHPPDGRAPQGGRGEPGRTGRRPREHGDRLAERGVCAGAVGAGCAPWPTPPAKRAPNEPNTPTLREMGIDVYIENQKGFVFPKGTPEGRRAETPRQSRESLRRSRSSRPMPRS
ncbi:MAG: tripartite tricarboxylate transporter substrate-binding protein [Comamonadaceae bacterium]|nr:tripartite tricarboxylate transporter substrate-binding protein [Comamonadaceae bacterium]